MIQHEWPSSELPACQIICFLPLSCVWVFFFSLVCSFLPVFGDSRGDEEKYMVLRASDSDFAATASNFFCLGRPGGYQVGHERTMCPCCKEGEWCPGLHYKGCCQQVEGGDLCLYVECCDQFWSLQCTRETWTC